MQMYTLFDSIIAGRAISPDALAAIGASYPITMIFMAVAIGSSAGASVIVSQLFGARKRGAMKTAVYTALTAAFFLLIKYIKNRIYSAVVKSFFQPEKPMKSTFLLCRIRSCNEQNGAQVYKQGYE